MGKYKDLFINIAVKGTTIFVVYQIYCAYQEQKKVSQALQIKQQRRKYGADFQLTPQKKQIVIQAEHYLKNHAGLKLLNRAASWEQKQQQFNNLIRQKQQQLDNLIKNDGKQENIQNLQHQLRMLADVFKKQQGLPTGNMNQVQQIPSKNNNQDSDKEVYYEKI